MKRYVILFLISLLILISPGYALEEYEVEDGVIVFYDGDVSELTVPEKINGQKIIGIGEFAFEWNYDLEKVTVPGTIQYIASGAFAYCKNLKEITIEEGITKIYSGAFARLESLEKINLPESVTQIPDDTFMESADDFTIRAPQYKTKNLQEIHETEVSKLAKDLASSSNVTYEPTNYAVYVNSINGGSLDLSKRVVEVGETIDLNLTIYEGYEKEKFTYTVNGSSEIEITGNQLEIPEGNVNITVKLKQIKYKITATAVGNGTISPEGETEVIYGRNSSRYVMTPDFDHRIKSVKIDGVELPNKPSKYTFTNVREPHTIEVEFEEIPKYAITVSVVGNGTVTPSDEKQVREGEDSEEYIITPDADYRIKSIKMDGVENPSKPTKYKFYDVMEAHTIEVEFEEIPKYAITVTVVGNGTVTPSDEKQVREGEDSEEYIITPDADYRVKILKIDGIENASKPLSYTFTNVTAVHTLYVEFEKIPYKITATAVGKGTIEPDGEVEIKEGEDSEEYVITPDSGYRIKVVKIDGVEDPSKPTEHTFTNVTEDHTIYVEFEKIPVYKITATAKSNGTITPSGRSEVLEGEDSAEYVITPNTGYSVDTVKIDGVVDPSKPRTYTFTNVTEDHTIEVTFRQSSGYIITATAGANGSISPSEVEVAEGDDSDEFTITPDAGYTIDTVKIDGVADPSNPRKYKFTNVTEDHTIEVTFRQADYYNLTTNMSNVIETTVSKPEGSEVTVSTGENTSFTGWSITGLPAQNTRSFTFYMPSNSVEVTYNYPEPNYNTTTIESTPVVSGDKATSTLNQSELTAAIAVTGSDTVEIVVAEVASEAEVEVIIPTTNMEEIEAKENITQLKIETAVGTLSIHKDAIEGINSQAGGSTVAISIRECSDSELTASQQAVVGDSPVYKFEVISNGNTISEFNGSIVVTLPYTPSGGEDTSEIKVYYIDESGNVEEMSTIYSNNTVSFTTTHFSEYFIKNGIEEPEEKPDEGTGKDPEINPDEGTGKDPEINPDEGTGKDPEVTPDEGTGKDPEINPDEGTGKDPEINPDEGTGKDPEITPDEGTGKDPEVTPDEGTGNDPEINPDEGTGKDPEVTPDEGTGKDPEVNPDEGNVTKPDDDEEKKSNKRKGSSSKSDPEDEIEEIKEEVLPSESQPEEQEEKLKFTDIKDGAWYIDAIKYAVKNNIASGTTETTFSPSEPITRGQVVTMLCKAYNIAEESEGENFVDAGETYYTGYILALKNKDLLNGIGNNKVEPKRDITRQELLVLLYKILEYTGNLKEVPEAQDEVIYSDRELISSWAEDAVNYFIKTKIIVGHDGKINPKGKTTRAEMVQIIYNLNKE